MMILFYFILLMILFILLSKFHSIIENFFIRKGSNTIIKSIDTHSLELFKIFRFYLFIGGALESALMQPFELSYFFLGVIIFLSGITLRILAISSLGPFWSFNVVKYENHQVIRTGIYRYLRHPAYIGNVYLVGLFISFSSYVTATIALIFVSTFYVYRKSMEEKLISSLEQNHGKITIISRNIKQSI